MPRYFYDISKGAKLSRDTIGSVCRDNEAAMKHAWSALPTMASDADLAVDWQHHELSVRREDGLHIGRIDMTLRVERANPTTKAVFALKPSGGSFA